MSNHEKLRVIATRQAGGGVRYLALTAEAWAAIRSDQALLDCAPTEAVLDIAGRQATWECPARCADSARGREAIRAALREVLNT